MESSFQIAVCECPDVSANTMAVDPTGRYALVSGRKSMVLIDLDGNDCESSAMTAGGDETSVSSSQTVTASRPPSTSNQPKQASISKRVARNSKYESTSSQFNRHMSDLFALTTHQTAEIFSISDLNPLKPKIVLRGHSRAITDIDWSHYDPYLLGSSAADCLTNLWDIRDNRRPLTTLTSVSGATLVRFCKTSSNLIATSHEIDVRIWDIRQPNLPLYYIAAHLQKINGMDWNPNKTNCDQEQLITSSQDNTIKLWDLSSVKIKPTANFPTRSPAWRVRYIPISENAIITSTLPHLRSRSECMALKLWSMKPHRYEQKKLELILGLIGHTDVIVDFDIRARPSESSGCEIVSWSKDQTLRVWKIDHQLIEMNVENSDSEYEVQVSCENTSTDPLRSVVDPQDSKVITDKHDQNRQAANDAQDIETAMKSLKFPRKEPIGRLGGDDGDDDDDDSDQDSCGDNFSSKNELKLEFNLLNRNIPNIEFEELNSLRRVCLVTARAKSVSCRLRIALPPNYPQDECPTFTIIDSNQYGGESLNKEAKEKLLHLLDETAKSQLSRSRNCIEPCLRKFIAALQKISGHSAHRKRPVGSAADYKDDPITLSAQRDHSVPFPATSGARFCGNLLVCFGRPMLPTVNMSNSGSESANWLVETPRSMAQLSAQLDNMRRQGYYNLPNISISYFYYGAMRRAELQSRSSNVKNSMSGRISGGSGKHFPSRTKSSVYAQSMMSKSYKCGPVLVYDVSNLLGGICRDLAENYVFDKDVIKMCRRNAEIAAEHNRRDLMQIWSLAELSSEGVLNSSIPNDKDDENMFSLANYVSDFGDRSWTLHPFGSKLIQSLIDHYVYNCHDVQTAAMLVWTFSSPKLGRPTLQNHQHQQPLSSKPNKIYNSSTTMSSSTNYHTVMPGMLVGKLSQLDTISDDWNFVGSPETHLYSNSWSNSTVQEFNNHHSNSYEDANNQGCAESCRFPVLNILSQEKSLQNDLIMHIYAELLYRLNLLNQRAMVLKNVGSNSAYSKLFGNRQEPTNETITEDRLSNLTIQCQNSSCLNKCRSVQCLNCKKYSLYCSICRLPVRGSCSICLKCLHGGHVDHFNTWFNSYDFCPTGCGCNCLSMDLN